MSLVVGSPTSAEKTLAWNGSTFEATQSFTTTAGANVLCVALVGNAAPTTVLFNGAALTQRAVQSDGSVGSVLLYDIDNPSIGTYNVSVQRGNGLTYRITVFQISGVNTGTPRGNVTTASANNATATATLTTTTDQVVIGIASTVNTATTDGGQTEMTVSETGGGEYSSVSKKTASGSSTTLTWTQTSARWAVALQAYNPAPAPSGLTITSITPSQIDSGESFTITGTGFGSTQGLSLVQIGGVTQTPTSWSDSSITCTATRGSQSMGNATLTIYKM